MEVGMIIDFIVAKLPLVGSILVFVASGLTVVRAYVQASANKEDDAALAQLEAKEPFGVIFKAIEKFSLLKLKNPEA